MEFSGSPMALFCCVFFLFLTGSLAQHWSYGLRPGGIGAVLKVLTTGLPALISWIKRKRQQHHHHHH
nr:lhmlt fusion protein [synthetic construct]